MRKFAASVCIGFLSCLALHAQSQTAETGLAANLSDEYKSWRSVFTATKTYLVLPQDKYVPGDTVFFSAFFLTDDGHYVSGMQILRIVIINSSGNTVHRQSISVMDGVGSNQIILPGSMSEGCYFIVAYNDYMKSFSQSFYFRKEIRIVEKNSIELDVTSMRPIIAVEGGHLVQGVPNRVVIVAPDTTRHTVSITDAFGLELATTTLDRHGTGSVVVTPRAGDQYSATLNGNRSQLPPVESDGCSLQVSAASNAPLIATITIPNGSKLRESEMVAALTIDGVLYFSGAIKPSRRGTVKVRFPHEGLPGGLALVSIIAGDGNILASRHFYMPSPPSLNCDVQIKDASIRANEKVTSEITVTTADGKPVEVVFTVAAVNESLFDRHTAVFPIDLNVVSEITQFAGRSTSADWLAAVDNYLAAQPGNIPWPMVMSKKDPDVIGLPKFVTVSGQAFFAGTQQPIPDSSTIAGYMKNNHFDFEFKSGKQGALDFGFLSLTGKDEMFFFAQSEGRDLEGVKIRWTYDSLALRAGPWKAGGAADAYASFMETKNAIDRSFDFYGTTKKWAPAVTFDSPLEADLMNTGTTINVQEFKVFPSMEEMIREIIPRLTYRKVGRQEGVRVLFSGSGPVATSTPLYIIDGVLTRNNDLFLSLNPADILTLTIIHDPVELRRFYRIGMNGIVIVKTRNGNGARNAERSSVAIEGINPAIPFRLPVELRPGTRRKPDFRSTIYWNPVVRTDKNGKATVSFFPTDDIGRVRITVRGFAGSQSFEVEKIVEVVR